MFAMRKPRDMVGQEQRNKAMKHNLIDEYDDLDRVERHMRDVPSGWWILPAAFVGGLAWIALFTWVMFNLMGVA